MLPFNAFGTMAIAREEFDSNSGSSQFFWLLKVGCNCLGWLLRAVFRLACTALIRPWQCRGLS